MEGLKKINIGDIYWMPSNKPIDKKSIDIKLIVTKVGTKFIYANNEDTNWEYKFTFKSDGVLDLVNNMCSGQAYSEEQWEKQKLIIKLDKLTQKFKQEFSQINNSTDFKKYQKLVSEMNELSQKILNL
jgi:hypothetical protein